MGLQNDIFISYAHDDNVSFSFEKEADGWIDDFHRLLEIRLRQLIGNKPKIWRDTELRGNDYFNDEIPDQYIEAVLLVSVLSPRYIESDWCKKELQEFIDNTPNSNNEELNNKSRVFKVVKTKVPIEKHPKEIKDLLGYNFYTENEKGEYLEFNKNNGKHAEQAYWMKLEDLARDIRNFLVKYKNEIVELTTITKGKVFLAETSYDQHNNREQVRRELEAHGYEVVPKQNTPHNLIEEYQNYITNLLEECIFSIHIFGSLYGKTPEDSSHSIIEVQHNLAAKNNLNRFLWVSPDTNNDEIQQDPRQVNLINDLKKSTELLNGAEVFSQSIQELRTASIDKLNELIEKEVIEEEVQEQDLIEEKSIYIICDQSDREQKIVNPLKKALIKEGYCVTLTAFNGDEDALKEDCSENLKSCDIIIIFYGLGDEPWKNAKERELKKIKGYGRNKPFLGKAIYLSSPDEYEDKEDYTSRDLFVIDGLNNKLPEEAIKDFLINVENGEK